MKRRIIIIAVVVVVIGALIGFFALRGQQAAEQAYSDLETEVAETGSLQASVGATGVVRANQTATLAWETSGTVEDVMVEIGDQVSAEDKLAQLGKKSLAQNLILAEADLVNVKQALEDLKDAYSALAVAQAAQAVANAKDSVDFYQTRLNSLNSPAPQVDIDQAEANVVLAGEQLDDAQEKYEPYESKPDTTTKAALKSALAQAQKNYDSAVRLLNNLQGTANDLDLEVGQANLELAQQQLADAQSAYEDVKAGPDPDDIAAAEARIAATESTLAMAYIEAPFAGTITQVVAKSGDQVAPGLIAFRIDDLSHLLVDVDISEVDINRIEVGQIATLTFDAIQQEEYNGTVVEVSPVGDLTQGVVNFKVTVELTDADASVRPGMTAAVNIIVQEFNDALLVPNRAVRLLDGNRIVYVLNNMNQLEIVKVELGASSDNYSQVVGGDLKAGEKLVLNPPLVFGPGGESMPPPNAIRR
ncbi:MAG: efflux RND transporter periplasmic adaptor subunit [Anaerolineales bacterium]|nr:efflux RND transporter periplasmic adaptor subunit [Anaerolineales bacterium]